jgi:putative endonuclease
MTTKYNKVLYIGMCNNLVRRVNEHKNKINDGFTKKYNINKLVYFEYFDNVEAAIGREKQLKGWKRDKKIKLISEKNPEWKDLYHRICKERN